MVSSLITWVKSEFDSIGILTNVRICNFEIWGLSVPECKPFKSFAQAVPKLIKANMKPHSCFCFNTIIAKDLLLIDQKQAGLH